jgi:hypothetical protein
MWGRGLLDTDDAAWRGTVLSDEKGSVSTTLRFIELKYAMTDTAG